MYDCCAVRDAWIVRRIACVDGSRAFTRGTWARRCRQGHNQAIQRVGTGTCRAHRVVRVPLEVSSDDSRPVWQRLDVEGLAAVRCRLRMTYSGAIATNANHRPHGGVACREHENRLAMA